VDGFREIGKLVQQRLRVGRGEHVLERLALLELKLVVAAPDGEPQQVFYEVRLGLEDRPNGRLGNSGCVGDVFERRGAVTLVTKGLPRSLEDPLARSLRLLLAQWRVVGLDTPRHSDILSIYSLAVSAI
jgi:hypothetical protein